MELQHRQSDCQTHLSNSRRRRLWIKSERSFLSNLHSSVLLLTTATRLSHNKHIIGSLNPRFLLRISPAIQIKTDRNRLETSLCLLLYYYWLSCWRSASIEVFLPKLRPGQWKQNSNAVLSTYEIITSSSWFFLRFASVASPSPSSASASTIFSSSSGASWLFCA